MDNVFPRNLIEFTQEFSTEEACYQYMLNLRWPEGFVCPHCESKLGWITARGTFFCKDCERQTSLTAGTILNNTRVPLRIDRCKINAFFP